MIPFESPQTATQAIRVPTATGIVSSQAEFADVWNAIGEELTVPPRQLSDVGLTAAGGDDAIVAEGVSPANEIDTSVDNVSLTQEGHDPKDHTGVTLDETKRQKVGKHNQSTVETAAALSGFEAPPSRLETPLGKPKTALAGTAIASRVHVGEQVDDLNDAPSFKQQAVASRNETLFRIPIEGISMRDTQANQGVALIAPEVGIPMTKNSLPMNIQNPDASLAKGEPAATKQAISTPVMALEKTVASVPALPTSANHSASKLDRAPDLRKPDASATRNPFGQTEASQNKANPQLPIVPQATMPFIEADSAVEQFLVDEPELMQNNGLSTTTSGRTLIAHPLQSHAQPIAQQIAAAMVQTKTGLTEIALNPQELGRVKMTLKVTDSGVAVSIIAERPETSDLMRRNIEVLAREFRDIGYGSVSFSFDDQSSRSDDGTDNPSADNTTAEHLPFEADPMALPSPVAVRSGLDLKL